MSQPNRNDSLSVLHTDDPPFEPDPRSRPDCAAGWNPHCPYRKELS